MTVVLAWAFISGFIVSAIVAYWPSAWQYAPGIIFGIVVAAYFARDVWRARTYKAVAVFELAAFVAVSYFAYTISLFEAQWVLGTNGFATFSSYGTESALSALVVGCFVGGCIGAFILALAARLMFLKFDLVRGLFLFTLFSGALGSAVAIGFETLGFMPQFIFPFWHLGMMAVILYLERESRA